MGGEGSGKIDKEALVSLDGKVLRPDGTTTRTKIFEFLDVDLDDYSDIQMTGKEAQRFVNHVKRMKTGVAAFVPKLCPGPSRCPLGERCPFQEKFPLGRSCPLEVNYIKVKTKNYIESLDVEPDNAFEMSLVNSLVECDLFDYRMNIALAGDEDASMTLLVRTIMKDEKGGSAEILNPHPLLTVKETVHRKRAKILDMFAATRQQEYKKAAALGKESKTDASNQMANLRELADRLIKAEKVSPVDVDRELEEAE